MEENEARLRLELERKEKKEFNDEKRKMEEILRKVNFIYLTILRKQLREPARSIFQDKPLP